MKYTARFFTFLLSLFLCVLVLVGTVWAQEPLAATRTQRVNALTELIAAYEQKDGTVGNQVKPILQSYRTVVENLDLDTTGWALDSYYYQGVSAGTLSWIYYSHPEVHPSAAEDQDSHPIYSCYAVERATISSYDPASKTDEELSAFFLGSTDQEPLVNDCYTRLLNAIYAKKLTELKHDGDSEKTRSLIESAALRLSTPDPNQNDPLNPTPVYQTEDADNYNDYYEYVVARVTEQRNRDAIENELESVYRVLHPDVSFTDLSELADDHAYMESFLSALPEKTTVDNMNSLLCSTVTAMLNEAAAEQDFYTNNYLKNTLVTKVTTTTAAATVQGKTASLKDSCFGDAYLLDRAKAEAKDELAEAKEAVADLPFAQVSVLTALLAEYNDDAGRINACDSTAAVEEQLRRGHERLDWFEDYLAASATLEAFFSEDLTDVQKADLSERLHTNYASTDEKLRDGVEATRADGQAALAQILCDAETEAYLNRHPIVSALPAPPTATHRAALAEALADAAVLSVAAQDQLESTRLLSSLAEAYKTATEDALQDKLSPSNNPTSAYVALDALKKHSLDTLTDKLDKLAVKDDDDAWLFTELLRNADDLLRKATEIGSLIDGYQTELLSENPSFYLAQMQAVCDDAASKILAVTDGSEAAISADAAQKLARLKILEAIRAAADEHLPVTGVDDLLSDAEAALLPSASNPPADLTDYKTDILFRLDNCLLAKELEAELDKLNEKLDTMTYLTEAERQSYLERIDALKEPIDAIRAADDQATQATEIDTKKKAFSDALDALWADTAADDLRVAKEEANKIIGDRVDRLTEAIDAYKYLSADEKAAQKQALADWQASATASILACEDTTSVAVKQDELLASLDAMKADADRKDEQACLAQIKAYLEQYRSHPEEYSAENMVKIQECVLQALTELEKASSIAEYLSIWDAAKQKLDAIPTLLCDAQTAALERLQSAYAELLQREKFYSESALTTLDKLYGNAKASVTNAELYKSAADIAALDKAVEQAIAELRAVKMDRVQTDRESPVQGSISSPNAIPYNATLFIHELGKERIALGKQIQNAAKNNLVRMANGEAVDRALLKALKHCVITSALSFDLGELALSEENTYEISLRLSEVLDLSNLLGIVYIGEDGSVEFHEVDTVDSTVVFSSTHASHCFLVSAKVVNLLPAIIVLGTLILCEIAVLILLYWRRARRAAGMNALSIVAPVLAVRYRPSFGLGTTILLALVAAGLAAWIVALLLAERAARKPQAAPERIEEEIPLPVLAVAEPLPVKPAPAEPLPEITPELAEELMSDECAKEQTQTEESYVDHEIYRGSKRATINLDTISASFNDGDTVTLNDLKRKKLVAQNVGFVKILARGRLDKALTVLAQDFSTAAIKMIILTGGAAIRTHQSKERQKTKK